MASWTNEELDAYYKSTTERYERMYAAGEYQEMGSDYCHEGFNEMLLNDNQLEIGICSFGDVIPNTTEFRRQFMKRMADEIIKRVRAGSLGC